ncbi:MAG: Stk1 family PASTA domain-containing Ser/Thr kinase [Bacillota bacterium]
MIGRVLGDRYEIVERLGTGGMSTVYRARCSYLHRDVAVKVLHGQLAHDEEFLDHFRKEAWAAARLSHPNIVGIYDVGQEPDEDLYYIVMEHVQGPTLARVLDEEERLPPDRAIGIAVEILKALNFAHQKGVVHRDIKPDNVIIDETGRVKVTDFGIARAADSGTIVANDSIMGSARYMAPEQARGSYTDARADLYAAGVVLYEMLTGRVPFDGEGIVEIAMSHVNGEVPDPRAFNPEISDDLAHLVFKALEKEPARRYSTAEAMGRDLVKIARGEPLRRDRLGRDDRTRVLAAEQLSSAFGEDAGALTGDGDAPEMEVERHFPEDGEVEEQESRKGPSAAVVILLILTFAALGVVGYAGYLVYDWLMVPAVDVPPVSGERLATAESILQEHGLKAEVVASRHDDEIPANYVIQQDPAAQRQVRRGHTVLLTISEGPEWIEGGVPDVLELTRQEAEVSLGNVGLSATIEERHHDDVPRGHVIDQVPEPGARVQRGSEIALEVSLGPEPRPFNLAGFIGKRESAVVAELASAELSVNIVRENADFPEGIVIDQEPAPGSEVTAGDTVTLVVSRGTDRTPNEETISFQLPTEPAVQNVRVELIDQFSQRVVYQDRLEGGTSVEVTLYWYGIGARAFAYSGSAILESFIFEEPEETEDPDQPAEESDEPPPEEAPGPSDEPTDDQDQDT